MNEIIKDKILIDHLNFCFNFSTGRSLKTRALNNKS